MLVDQAVVVPGPITEALGAAARAAGSCVVIAGNPVRRCRVGRGACRPPVLPPSRPPQPPRHLPTAGGYPLPTCGRPRSHVGQPDARRADREARNSEPVMRGSQPLRMQVDCSLTRSRRSVACHSAQFVTNRRTLRHKSITTASSISTPAAVSVKILPSLGSHRFLPHRRRDTSRRP
jgi:hypothetical protein